MELEKKLRQFYSETSKHSNYQVLPSSLRSILNENTIDIKSRFERERLDYILKNVDIDQKSILDIGGNTGYFSIESLEKGACSVHYFEGNPNHAEFVRLAAAALGIDKKLIVNQEYFSFTEEQVNSVYDVVFLLNVLHHFGDDYGEKSSTLTHAKEKIAASINFFRDKTKYLILQLGFCWKGDRNNLLFEEGTKSEMITFIEGATSGLWTIEKIGIPVEHNNVTLYKDLDNENVQRFDSLGEFRNRPLFILRSLEYSIV